jgi:hypothetical protein
LGHASAKSQQFHQRDGTNQLEEEERISTLPFDAWEGIHHAGTGAPSNQHQSFNCTEKYICQISLGIISIFVTTS